MSDSPATIIYEFLRDDGLAWTAVAMLKSPTTDTQSALTTSIHRRLRSAGFRIASVMRVEEPCAEARLASFTAQDMSGSFQTAVELDRNRNWAVVHHTRNGELACLLADPTPNIIFTNSN